MPVERRLVDVEDADAHAGLGECQAQREADMAAAPEDDDIEVVARVRHASHLAVRLRGSRRP